MKRTLLSLLILIFIVNLTATLNENFENGSKSSYALGSVDLASGNWSFENALLGTLSNDRKFDSKSVRVKYESTLPGNFFMNFDKTDGVGEFKIYHARYGSDLNQSWTLYMSTDSGSSWNQVGSEVQTTSTILTQETFSINQSGNVRFKIVITNGVSSDRLNFDNVEITDYGTGSNVTAPQAFTATANGEDEIQLAFQTNGTDPVFIVYDMDNTFSSPTNGDAVPAAGSAYVGGTVLYNGSGSSYNHTGLNAGDHIYYRIYSVDANNDYSTYLSDDAATETNYYSGISGSGATLKSQLSNLIDGHTSISYTAARYALEVLDADPDIPGNIVSFYTGWSFSNTLWNVSNGWNREHVWSQSHGDLDANNSDGYTDLHHLRAEDATVNAAKNNRDFDEGGSAYTDSSPAEGTSGVTGCYYDDSDWTWEPRDEVKGDVARAIFYMDTRYEGNNGELDLEILDNTNVAPNREPYYGKLTTLLRWHNEDPVSTEEAARNELIYTDYQHNRNPYIDHPEYAGLVYGNPVTNQSITSYNFGNVEVGYESDEISFTVTGTDLYDDVTVTAPSGFMVSHTAGSGFTQSITLPMFSRSVNTTVYMKFAPLVETAYNADVIVSSPYDDGVNIITVSGTGGAVESNADLVINEWSQGSDGAKEWVELLILSENANISGYHLTDGNGSLDIEFSGTGFSNLAQGSVIVIYNGGDVDGVITPDLNYDGAGDTSLQISSLNDTGDWALTRNTGWSNTSGAFSNSTSTDVPQIADGRTILFTCPKHAAGNETAYFTENSAIEAQDSANWATDVSSNASPATGNGGNNTIWVVTLPVTLASFNGVFTAEEEVELNWVTESESEMMGYQVYRAPEDNFAVTQIVSNLIPAQNTSTQTQYSYTDTDIETNSMYYYWIESIDNAGMARYYGPVMVSTEVEDIVEPDFFPKTGIVGNYPNPFNPETKIVYNVMGTENEYTHVDLRIYNIRGQMIKKLVDEAQAPGENKHVTWFGKDKNNNTVGSGVYFVKLRTDDNVTIKKITLLK